VWRCKRSLTGDFEGRYHQREKYAQNHGLLCGQRILHNYRWWSHTAVAVPLVQLVVVTDSQQGTSALEAARSTHACDGRNEGLDRVLMLGLDPPSESVQHRRNCWRSMLMPGVLKRLQGLVSSLQRLQGLVSGCRGATHRDYLRLL
jgi:hypothetical protein